MIVCKSVCGKKQFACVQSLRECSVCFACVFIPVPSICARLNARVRAFLFVWEAHEREKVRRREQENILLRHDAHVPVQPSDVQRAQRKEVHSCLQTIRTGKVNVVMQHVFCNAFSFLPFPKRHFSSTGAFKLLFLPREEWFKHNPIVFFDKLCKMHSISWGKQHGLRAQLPCKFTMESSATLPLPK